MSVQGHSRSNMKSSRKSSVWIAYAL